MERERNPLLLNSRRTQKRVTFTAMLLCFSVLFSFVGWNAAYAAEGDQSAGQVSLQLEVQSAILIEAESGQILFETNKDVLLAPASMAKMMSEYVVLEAITDGKIGWDDIVSVSKHAADTVGSGQLLAEGETYTVRQLFENMSIFSGNDATVALAEYVAGSERDFAKVMNDKAQEIGMSDGAYFANATGLDNADAPEGSLEGDTRVTAYDLAILARHIVLDHPEALEISSMTESYLKPGDDRYRMTSWNWMLEGWKSYNNNFSKFSYEGLDGLKTGHTASAGYCFTGTAERNGMRLISVVMGTKNEPSRFNETRKLMDYGFNNFEKRIALQPKIELEQLPIVEISKGKVHDVSVVTEQGVSFIVRKNAKPEDFVIEAVAAEEDIRVAPISKGQVLGTATVTYTSPTGEKLSEEVNLIAADDVEKANWFMLLLRAIGNFFKELFNGIKNLF